MDGLTINIGLLGVEINLWLFHYHNSEEINYEYFIPLWLGIFIGKFKLVVIDTSYIISSKKFKPYVSILNRDLIVDRVKQCAQLT